jgi:hypothetical protein
MHEGNNELGLDYSFIVVLSRSELSFALEKLCTVLYEEDRLRMQRCLPWEPEVERYQYQVDKGRGFRECLGIRSYRLMKEEYENDYCLTMCFKRDKVIGEYEDQYNMNRKHDMIMLGCIWTSVYAGNRFAAITSTAATTGMSLLFQRSPSIKKTWTGLAQKMKAIALFFDQEEGDQWNLIYPARRKVMRPDDDAYWIDESLMVDAYYQDAIRLAGIEKSSMKP